MDNTSLDLLAVSEGTELKEDIKCVDKEKILNEINNSFAYDDGNTPIPGESVDFKLDEQINSINKESAMNDLIMKSAMIKAKEESEKNLTKEQKAAKRKAFIDQTLYQNGEFYFQIYHHIMDSHTKKVVTKKIEKAYDKHKFNKNGIYFDVPRLRYTKPTVTATENKEPVNVDDFYKKPVNVSDVI